MNYDWLKIFYECKADKWGLISELSDLHFKENIVTKKSFLRRIHLASKKSRSNVYWEFDELKASGLIEELPKKQIKLNLNKIVALKKEWKNVTKRNLS